MKYCLTVDQFRNKQEYKTFKGFNFSKRLLDRSQYFKVIEGKKIPALLPKSWKKLFNSGINIPQNMRFCNEYNDKIMCNNCKIQVYEKKKSRLN